ncbi:PA14 domain-containing protein, partial [Paenibacillus larvae]|uniref:binary toxin-like calcium binding domain-containing protein n=1 Tax=Paenibacillus larvae TaxID=1464 RepID=UPI00227DE6AD
FQSILWTGYIKPSETNDYFFSTSDDEYVALKIDGHLIMNGSGNKESVHLEKDKLYKIIIEYTPEENQNIDVLNTFKVFWEMGGGQKEIIPGENLVLPTRVERSQEDRILPMYNANGVKKDEHMKDTDDDGIPDEWEINGYTVVDHVVVKWDEGKHAGKYKKFVSDPYDAHTAGDPYTDYEKASGIVDKAILKVAHNPLVPAYPSIGVSMDKFIISTNENIEEGTDKSLTISRGSSSTKTIDYGVTASLHASLIDFGASVSASFHTSSSQTMTTEKSEGKSWSQRIGMNTTDRAHFNGNIRYYNRATAPIYNVEPTLTLVLDATNNAQSLFTVKVKENQKAEVIKPGDSYPRRGLSSISLRNMDDFGSAPIPLTFNQVNALEAGTPLSLETDQFTGEYIKVANGKQYLPQPWSYWLTQIESSSARIILDDGDKEIERRIAARTVAGYETETKPEVTLGEALRLTFGIEQKDHETRRFTYNGDPIHFVFDKDTAEDIKNQLRKMEMPCMDNVKLKAGMQIMLQTNLVHNGSFKNGLNGWIVTKKSNSWNNYKEPKIFKGEGPDGVNVLDTGDNSIEKTVKLNPNLRYHISCNKDGKKEVDLPFYSGTEYTFKLRERNQYSNFKIVVAKPVACKG